MILGKEVMGENPTQAVTSSHLSPCRLTAEKVRNSPGQGEGEVSELAWLFLKQGAGNCDRP